MLPSHMTINALRPLNETMRQRLEQPLRRGAFRPLDAARQQLGLLTVADTAGQARIYWLVNLDSNIIEDARFIAFGSLLSHPICDAFMELAREHKLEEVCQLSIDDIATVLDCDSADIKDEAAFIFEMQTLALAERPNLKLLPKPVEIERYQRKRDQDWDEHDKQWLPLSLLKKIAMVNKVLAPVIADRIGRPSLEWSVEALNDDFQLTISWTDNDNELHEDEKPTLARFCESAVQEHIHPAITVVSQ